MYSKHIHLSGSRNSYRGDKTDRYTLCFDEEKGFYVSHMQDRDSVSPGSISTSSDLREIEIEEFLKTGPDTAVRKLQEMLEEFFE